MPHREILLEDVSKMQEHYFMNWSVYSILVDTNTVKQRKQLSKNKSNPDSK